MGELFEQLGINWKLFISQSVNFLILLLVLRAFVYKPLLEILDKREKRIKEGLDKANEAEVRLREVDDIAKGKIKEAETESIEMTKKAELNAKALEATLVEKAEKNHKELVNQLEKSYKRQEEEVKKMIYKEASGLVKNAIIKTIGIKPEAIDEKLIEEAVLQVKNEGYEVSS